MTKRLSLNTALLAGLAGAAGLTDEPCGSSIGQIPPNGWGFDRIPRGDMGKVPCKHAAKRRAANKIARKSRKANRSKKR